MSTAQPGAEESPDALPRLSRSTLAGAGPARPVRLVHLGLGAFHRAHQAWYTDRADRGAGDDHGIAAFTGRSPAAAEPLVAQDGLYTLLTRGPDGDRADVLGAVSSAHDGADTEAWCRHLASPDVGVLTLTVTEAGYRRGEGGGLDLDDGQVRADVEALRRDTAAQVVSAPARVVQGLLARHRAGSPGMAVVSCDNLADNGAITRRVVLDACAEVDPALADWVGAEVSFVSTMVDRITPATTDEDRATASRLVGRRDDAAVVTEPFSEWVLAGEFPAGRPRWEEAGAEVVADVTPFEQRKLWLLNAGHSLLAYAAPLRGHTTIADAVGDEVCRGWLEELWDDASSFVPLPDDAVARYRRDLVERFANPRIRHLLAQIGKDGSQKIPLRVVPVVRRHRERGTLPVGEARALAAWTAHLRGSGASVADPGGHEGAELARGVDGPADEAVRTVLRSTAPDLAEDGELCDLVAEQLTELERGSA